MSYKQMIETLESSFNSNVQKIRRKKMFGDAGEKLSVPVLSGLSGIGKTSSVKEFAKSKNFDLANIDCSFEEANTFIAKLNNAIQSIENGEAEGFVFLLDNINNVSKEYLEIIGQYQENYLNASILIKIAENKKSINSLDSKKINIVIDTLPEKLIIVGEQRPN